MTENRKKRKKNPRKKSVGDRSESQQVSGFLRSIGYHRAPEQTSYGSALDVLKTIFEATGQHHLVHLVKLRRLWFKEFGGFLARHALPSGITVEEHFEVSTEFLENLRSHNPSSDLLQTTEDLLGRGYPKWSAFQSVLRRRLGRSLNQSEVKLLQGLIRFIPKHVLLHLTVYDGSIAQAIQFEEGVYLDRFQSILPELKLGGIRCKVGDLGNIGKDQIHFEELQSRWDKLLPKNIFSQCNPDHIHRINEDHAVLIVNCENPTVLKRFRLHPGGIWMLQQINKTFPDLANVVQKLAFICSPSGKSGSLRTQSVENAKTPTKTKKQVTEQNQLRKSDLKLSHKEQVHEIIRYLRGKSIQSNPPVTKPEQARHSGSDS